MKKDNKIKYINEYKKKKKNKNKNRNKGITFSKPYVIIGFICAVSAVIGNLCGYSIVSQLKYDIYYLKKDLRAKEIVIEQLNSRIYSNYSIEEIEKMAKEKINMDYPKESQIEYITVED